MPDLNSVPPSPRLLDTTRRHSSSQQLPSPSLSGPSSPSLNILPSNQNAVNSRPSSSSTTAAAAAAAATTTTTSTSAQHQQPYHHHQHSSVRDGNSVIESGPGPLRHPRPLTASELHIQLEKEQEAIVNRLTRDLSLLRAAHNASVASNHSSTSTATTSTHDAVNESSLLSGSAFTIPTSRRHRRNSSTTSQAFAASDPRHPIRSAQPTPMSRQGSAASRRSRAESPAPGSVPDSSVSGSYPQQQRMPPSSYIHVGASGGGQLSPGLVPATARYEETVQFRNELEAAKKENEALKRRIRELERTVQERRGSTSRGRRPRSASSSTAASVNVAAAASGGTSVAGPRDGTPTAQPASRAGEGEMSTATRSVSTVGVGVPEREVQVGESAASTRPAGTRGDQ
ncbi:hypothetical protein GMORB2_7040 [Geosmithia morbida]|uniref:Uncharacterized protein n=1 Tax=Geosmithia morbida TaxID=1094350 RepID=A0A9P5D0H2_9HYPO|nr:uncharacterized protein GMORB2_7040 [Geosmithia morbida]KAF4122733.1 hypothetical protein GMORB2_7040 [Geosmithia morbida]